MTFIRKIEDFVCAHCGAKVVGNGYTNHCPKCLWSRHSDVDPGDREERCLGMMEPKRTEKKGQSFVIVHRCVSCGFSRKQKTDIQDDFEKIIELSATGES